MLNKSMVKAVQEFIENPSEETLDNIVAYHSCLLSQLVNPDGHSVQCMRTCPGKQPYAQCGEFRFYACYLASLVQFWRIKPAEAVLYAIQLLAFAKSYDAQRSSSINRKRAT
jgi:hypothetical protein